MSDVFGEVDRGLKEDNAQALARRFGPYVGAGVAAILIAVAAFQFAQGGAREARADAAEAYTAALRHAEAGRIEAATAALEPLATDGPEGYAMLARALLGALALQQNDPGAATTWFEQAADTSGDDLYGDLAALKALYLQFDGLSGQEVRLLATPLAREGRPYRAAAQELMAAAALRDGALTQAEQTYLELVQSPLTPPALRTRAEAGLAVIAATRARTTQSSAAGAGSDADGGDADPGLGIRDAFELSEDAQESTP